MLVIQLYLLGGLLTTLWGIHVCHSEHHSERKPWALGCIFLTLTWPPFLLHGVYEWGIDQIKWRA